MAWVTAVGVIREFRQSLLGLLMLHETCGGLESKYEVGKSGKDSISEGARAPRRRPRAG